MKIRVLVPEVTGPGEQSGPLSLQQLILDGPDDFPGQQDLVALQEVTITNTNKLNYDLTRPDGTAAGLLQPVAFSYAEENYNPYQSASVCSTLLPRPIVSGAYCDITNSEIMAVIVYTQSDEPGCILIR